MAITYIPFIPSQNQAPQFQVTLDGNLYTAIITWNLQGQRYYLNLYDLNGELVLCTVLTGSPVGTPIASMSWSRGTVSVVTESPHGLRRNATVKLTISGVTPDAYNGQIEAFVTGPTTFQYSIAANPGEMTVAGSINQNINLVNGYFTTPLVFRVANSQFEVGL